MTTKQTTPLPLATQKDVMRQIRQAFVDEQTAIAKELAATDAPIKAYGEDPNPVTRAAAKEAFAARHQAADLAETFPPANVEFFQREGVQAHLIREVHGVGDSLDGELEGILASYPEKRETIISRIAELGRSAMALAGFERSEALGKRDADEAHLLFLEEQTARCRSAIGYFRANPTQESFNNCEGVLGVLRHELSSAASSGR